MKQLPGNETSVQNVQAAQAVQTVRESPGSSSSLNELNILNGLNASKSLVDIQGVSKSFHKTVKESTTEIRALSDVSLSVRDRKSTRLNSSHMSISYAV